MQERWLTVLRMAIQGTLCMEKCAAGIYSMKQLLSNKVLAKDDEGPMFASASLPSDCLLSLQLQVYLLASASSSTEKRNVLLTTPSCTLVDMCEGTGVYIKAVIHGAGQLQKEVEQVITIISTK